MASIYLLIGSLFSPIIGLFTLFLNIKKYVPSKITVVLLSLILSIIGIYWFPWGDAQTHFYIYRSDSIALYFNFSQSVALSAYWIYDLVIYYIASITGNYVWGYWFWLFVPLAIYAYSVWGTFLKNKNDITGYTYLFILLFIIIGIREFLDLNRSTAAALIMIGGIIINDKKWLNRLVFVLMLVVSFLLHDMIKGIILLLPIFYFIQNKVKRSYIWMLVAFIFMCCSVLIRTVVLPLILSERNAEMYLEGVWGDGNGVQSGFMFICGWLDVIIFIIIFIFIVKNIHNIHNSLLLSLFLCSSIVVFACFGLWTIRERFVIFSIIAGTALIITEWSHLLFNRFNVVKFMILLSILRLTLILMLHYSSLYIHKSASNDPNMSVSITTRFIYTPTPLLLDVNNLGYSDKMYNKLYDRAHYGE